MREAGLLATLDTDDPAMTDIDLGRESRDVAHAQGFDRQQVIDIALDGTEGSWLHDVDRRSMRAESRARIAALDPEPAAG